MILNALLVVLVCKNDNLSDKGYKPIILQMCITDMLNLIIFTLYMPAYNGAGNVSIFYTLGFFNELFDNAPLFTQIIHRIWFFFVFLFVFSSSVQFLYRYLILCRDWKPSYRLYTGLYSPLVLFLLFFTILQSNGTIYVSRTSNALYRDYIFTDNPTNVDLLVLNRDTSNALSKTITLSIVCIPISIVAVCGIKIWLHLRRHFSLASDSSKSNQRLQRQVNYVLFIQGGMPIVGNLMGVCLNFLIINTESMVFLPHFIALANMVVNPLLTMLLVDSYRRAVFNLCLCKSATLPDTVIVVSSIVRKQ